MNRSNELLRVFLLVLFVGLVASMSGWFVGGSAIKTQAIKSGSAHYELVSPQSPKVVFRWDGHGEPILTGASSSR